MAHARREETNALAILREYLRNHPNELAQLKACSQKTLQRNMNRVFDDKFPLMIAPTEFRKQIASFNRLLNNMRDRPLDSDGSVRILSEQDKRQIQADVTRIAKIGARSLLRQNRVHPELVDLLGWAPYASQFDIAQLICAFVGATFALISTEAIKENPDVDQPAQSAVVNFLSQNYRTWVVNAIRETGHLYHTTDDEEAARSREAAAALEHALQALTVLSGGLVLFGLLSAGAALFSSLKRHSSHRRDHDHDDAPSSRTLY